MSDDRGGRSESEIIHRIAEQVEKILARQEELAQNNQELRLVIDAKFELRGFDTIQFQVANVILRESLGLDEAKVASYLLSEGIAKVISDARSYSELGLTYRPIEEFLPGCAVAAEQPATAISTNGHTIH